ncbi:MAG: GNAT family N-acetyltransferase [Pedobacter sp.]|nr:MAG: GNAT family N-acetyltransferase [Pedobacter sp.]
MTSKTTYIVRKPVLRPNQPIENCRFEGDDWNTTVHFGYYDEENLMGIVSVFEKKHSNWNFEKQIQIRGMAVLPHFQKKGIGEKLILKVLAFTKERDMELIWFNAREKAVPFYEKLGFFIKGTAFDIEGIGTHYLMYRAL